MSVDKAILDELRAEAIDSVEDRISSINDALAGRGECGSDPARIVSQVKLDTHSIKSVAGAYEISSLKAIAHRCEDYLFDIQKPESVDLSSIQTFVDRMAEALEAWVFGREFDVSEVSRSLPAKGGFNESEVTVSDIEVMLVMEPGIATRIITRELLECGYRMINVASTIDAIQLVPTMRPDAVIVSKEMPELSGVDLVCALKAMPVTRDIPVALITSDKRDAESLVDLPADVPILRKGSNFGDDVADVFVELGIL